MKNGLVLALISAAALSPGVVAAQSLGMSNLAALNAAAIAKPSKPAEKTPHFSVYSVQGQQAPVQVDGFGLYATSKDRAIDLASPDRRLEGPSGSLFNQAAGIGWRNHNMSAMVGYMKPSSVKSATQFNDSYTPVYRPRARIGIGWSLHF